ncbi:MAG: hypothetical protein NC489_09150 [Ruminococcus flavefaciens]|nr:hypothetical protein [Ruminococcus flavefaciens]
MAADPRTLPVTVVRKIQEVIRWHLRNPMISELNEPFEVSATLQVDPVTGKILDAHFIGGWKRDEQGKYVPCFGCIRKTVRDSNGHCTYPVYGKIPKPDSVHTEET